MAKTTLNASTFFKSRARMLVPAIVFALGFWILDTGNRLRLSDATLLPALLPGGEDLTVRLLVALAFAVAGTTLCSVLRRVEMQQEFSLQQSRHSEQKFQSLLESSFEWVLTIDGQGNILDASASAARLLGGDVRDLAGRPVDTFITEPGGDDPTAKTLRQGLRDGRIRMRLPLPVHATALGGRKFPAEIRVTPIAGAGNSRYVLSVRETTDRLVEKKTQTYSELQYRRLFDNLLDGVYRSRPDGTLLAVNAALVKMLGYRCSAELLSSGNTNEFYCDPDQRTKIVAMLDEQGVARNIEIRLRRRNGESLPVLANIRAVRDESGIEIAYEGTLSDISDIQKARADLEDSEERLRAVVETARDLIFVINENGAIAYCSPSAETAFAADPGSLIGVNLFERLYAGDLDHFRRHVEQVFVRPGIPRHVSCRVHTDRPPPRRHFEGFGTAYLTRKGELQAVIHCRDVTK